MSRPLLLAVPIAALALTACVDNNADSGFTILRNLVPADGCVVDPTATTFRPSGQIQTNSTRGYFFTPVARNDLLVGDGVSETQQIIFVEGGRVTVDFYDDAFFSATELADFKTRGVTRFTVPTSGAIDPDGGLASFGFEVVPLELIVAIAGKLPAPTPTNLFPSTLLDVTVQVYGTRAGSSIESNVFRYPIQVCDGCLVNDVGACDLLPADFTASSGGVCNLVQDGVIDCCTQVGPPALLCPARPPVTPT